MDTIIDNSLINMHREHDGSTNGVKIIWAHFESNNSPYYL